MDSWLPLCLLSSTILILSATYSFLSSNSVAVIILGILCLASLLLKLGRTFDVVAPAFWIACLLTTASDLREAAFLTANFVLYYPTGRIYANFSRSPSKLDVAFRHILLALLLGAGGGILPGILIPIFEGFPITIEVSLSLTILIVLLFEFLRRSLGRERAIKENTY